MKNQRGVALSGLMFWGVIAILLAILGMKVVPSMIEYYMLKKSTEAVVSSAAPDATIPDLRRAYAKYAEIDQIKLSPTDLEIFKENGKVVIAFSYEERIPLFGNVSLVIDYAGSTAD